MTKATVASLAAHIVTLEARIAALESRPTKRAVELPAARVKVVVRHEVEMPEWQKERLAAMAAAKAAAIASGKAVKA